MSVNRVTLLGRLGQDPELKYTPAGQPVCNFSIATSDHWVDKAGQKQEKVEWTRIVVWGKLGEVCNQYLKKGRQTFVEGKLTTRNWEDKDGKKCYTTEVIANVVQFIGDAPKQGAAPSGSSPDNPSAHGADQPNFTADDIPF